MKRSSLALFSAIVMALGCLSACHRSAADTESAAAAALLSDARQALDEGRFDEARQLILTLRQEHPTAIAIRRQAIATLDSVELMATRDSLLRYEPELEALRAEASALPPRVDGHTNEAYYEAGRRLRSAEAHYDELCTKVQFYLRKLQHDAEEGE